MKGRTEDIKKLIWDMLPKYYQKKIHHRQTPNKTQFSFALPVGAPPLETHVNLSESDESCLRVIAHNGCKETFLFLRSRGTGGALPTTNETNKSNPLSFCLIS
jgi:hypothetical protein